METKKIMKPRKYSYEDKIKIELEQPIVTSEKESRKRSISMCIKQP